MRLGWGASRALRTAILLVDLVAIAVIASSLYPFAAGKFNVDLPDASEVSWRVENGDLLLTAPVRVTNGGVFDVRDLRVSVFLADEEGRTLLDQTQQVSRIPAGQITQLSLGFTVDLDGLLAQGIDELVFNPTNLSARITAGASYTMGLVKVGIDYPYVAPWEPLIIDYGLLDSGISFAPTGTGWLLNVPYFLETSTILQGTDVLVDLELSNSSGALTSATAIIPLGGSTVRTLQFPLSNQTLWGLATQSQPLTAQATFAFAGLSVSRTFPVDWGAPLNGLAIGAPTVTRDELLLPLSFSNDAAFDLALGISGTLRDASGTTISTSTQSLQAPSGSPTNTSLTFALPPSGLRVGEAYTLTFSVTDQTSGLAVTTAFLFVAGS